MAVLVEAISVIFNCASLERAYRGGTKAFADFCRVVNNSFCCDGELARIGFTQGDAVGKFIERVGLLGLVHVRQGAAVDLVVADQRGGLLQRCDWADFGIAQLPGTGAPKVPACRLVGTKLTEVTVPEGWRYEGSISRKVAQADAEEAARAKRAVPKPGLAIMADTPRLPPLADLLRLKVKK